MTRAAPRAVARADWSLIPDEPAALATPWATAAARRPDGLYVEPESGRAASLSAWRDRIARHHEGGRPLWRRSPAGVAHIHDGDRFAFLWPVLDVWSAGSAATSGPLAGEWLLRSVRYELARGAAEEWVMARRAGVRFDVDARLVGALTTG